MMNCFWDNPGWTAKRFEGALKAQAFLDKGASKTAQDIFFNEMRL